MSSKTIAAQFNFVVFVESDYSIQIYAN